MQQQRAQNGSCKPPCLSAIWWRGVADSSCAELVLMGGWPGVGVGEFAVQAAMEAGTSEAPSLLVSLGSGWKNTGRDAMGLVANNLYFAESQCLTFDELVHRHEMAKPEKGNLGLLVVDDLQGLSFDGDGECAGRRLGWLARDIGCPILVITHLIDNPWRRRDKRPTTSDIPHDPVSDSVEQCANMIAFLHRDPSEEGVREVVINRQTFGAPCVNRLGFDEEALQFFALT